MTAEYYQPDVLDEALALVAKGAIPVAGATAVFAGLKPKEGKYVDLTKMALDTLDMRDQDDELVVGPMVTLAQLSEADNIPGMTGKALRQCASVIATPQLRNMITIGGNVAHLVYWEDMPVVLVALQASLRVERQGAGAEVVALDKALGEKQPPWKGGLITAVMVPIRGDEWGFGHHRFTKTVTDYPLASACVTLKKENGVAKDVRVVVGAATPRAARLDAVERLLEGQAIDDVLLDKATDEAMRQVALAPNHRAPADYRRQLVGVMVKRSVRDAWTSAGGE